MTNHQKKIMKVFNKKKPHPEEAVYIGRGSLYGNQFIIGIHGTRDEVCDKFEAYVEADPSLRETIKKNLVGKDLLCFCKPARCHGDYLLRIANEDEAKIVTIKQFTTLIF